MAKKLCQVCRWPLSQTKYNRCQRCRKDKATLCIVCHKRIVYRARGRPSWAPSSEMASWCEECLLFFREYETHFSPKVKKQWPQLKARKEPLILLYQKRAAKLLPLFADG